MALAIQPHKATRIAAGNVTPITVITAKSKQTEFENGVTLDTDNLIWKFIKDKDSQKSWLSWIVGGGWDMRISWHLQRNKTCERIHLQCVTHSKV